MGKTISILLIIFCIGFLLRILYISTIPFLDGDEAYFGYYGFSLGREGTDEYRRPLPVFFQSLGDYKYPIYAYMSVPGIKLFGLNIVTTRIVSALAGSLSIFVFAILIYYLTTKRNWAMFASLALSLSPWNIMVSRKALEANLGLFLFLLGLTVLIRNPKSHIPVFGAGLMLTMAMLSYSAVAVFILLFCIVLLIKFAKQFNFRSISYTVVLIVGLAASLFFLTSGSRQRADGILIWQKNNFETLKKRVDLAIFAEGISTPRLPIFTVRVLHNKLSYLGKNLISNIISHLNPEIWIINAKQGDRFALPSFGVISLAEGIFLILGLVYMIRFHFQLTLFTLTWWLLGLIPSSLTTEQFHIVRTLISSPAAYIFISAGMYWLFANSKLLGYLSILILILGFIGFADQYLIQRRFDKPWIYESASLELTREILNYQGNYKQVSAPREMYQFYVFNSKTLPSQAEPWQVGNIIFDLPSGCSKLGKENTLYVCRGTEVPQNASIIYLSRFADTVPAYTLIDFHPLSTSGKLPNLPVGVTYMHGTDTRFGFDGLLPQNYKTPYF